MSDEHNAPLEFSAFDLMPDWAQESKDAKPKPPANFKDRKGDDDRSQQGRRGGGNFERRGGGDRRGGGGGDRRGGGGGDRRGGGGGDRRGGGGGYQNDRRGGGRGNSRDGGRGGYQHQEEFQIRGLKAIFEPTPESAQSLTKHIRETARAYPVADLAKMIANSRDRYQIRFRSEKQNGPALFSCKEDGSIWLSRDEAIAHFVQSKSAKKYYRIEEVELEAPKGNFATIAVCGFSGEILGPPNHHEYQNAIIRIHREKFSNMALDRYKSRIQMESGEEIITKWKEQVSKTRHYRLVSECPPEEEEVKAEQEPSAVEAEAPAENNPEAETQPEVAEAEAAPDAAVEEEASEAVEQEPAPEADQTEEGVEPVEDPPEDIPEPEKPVAKEFKEGSLVLKTPEELERHFRQNFADKEIFETREAVVAGNIPGRCLSQDLLTVIKTEGNKLRRGFPFEMFQAVCGCLEKEGLKFFKRGKKALHVSLIRPQAISRSLSLTDRIQKIINIINDNPKILIADVLVEMCEGFVKPDPDDHAKPELNDEAKAVLADIRWLTMEGYLVEFPDTHLELGKQPGSGPPQAQKKAASKRTRKRNRRRQPRVRSAGEPIPTTLDDTVIADAEEQDPHDPFDLPADVNPVA